MELRIQPFPRNTYPKKGLLIKGSSPLLWLQEMEFLGVNLEEVRSFPIPSNEPNVLYGCFLIFNHFAPSEIGKNAYFQCFEDRLFIPENTIFYPKLNEEDWQKIDAEIVIIHPDFGLVKLNEEIDWLSIIENPKTGSEKVMKASKGVQIPKEIKSFTVEMDDAKVLEALQKSQTQEEWMKDLPFDMKKVLAGNKKEIEKYLKYIEKYPDRAVELGVPLDILGTSRGDGFGRFRFGNSWFSNLFGGNSGGRNSENYRWVFWTVLAIMGLIRLLTFISKEDSVKTVETYNEVSVNDEPKPSMVGVEKRITDIDLKIDSMFADKRKTLDDEFNEALLLVQNKENPELYADYLKKGGKPLQKIQFEYVKINQNVNDAKDSLTDIYNRRIDVYLEGNKNVLKTKIKDSLRDAGSALAYNKIFIEELVEKRKIVLRDSMSYRFGIKEKIDKPTSVKIENSTVGISGNAAPKHTQSVSLLEVFGLIVLIIGGIFGYSKLVKKKSLDAGGNSISRESKFLLIILLVGMLVFIFYPLIKTYGYNWFVWILVVAIVFLLYRLFSEDKSILNSDKDE